tara:strand:+ start:4621 stop:5904 length:1284 start_codon:yes stop_codon:yes gene_type:complete
MIKEGLKKGQLYINYLGPLSALVGSVIATPILISNLGLEEWSLFALINIMLPVVYFVLFGSSQIVRRLMINIILSNNKAKESINMFYKHEKLIFFRFIPSLIFLSILLILFNSGNYHSSIMVELSLVLVSIAVLIKIFEFYYDSVLNGLKQHYKLHLSTFIITTCKWLIIIYLSSIKEIDINTILFTVIIFSILLLLVQRKFIVNISDEIQKKLVNQNKNIISEFKENDFGIVILLFMSLQQFDKVLVFGILEPLSLSYFGIAFMLSSIVPLIMSPLIGYLTPEIYQFVEVNSKDRKKYFSKLINIQLVFLFFPLVIINFYLEQILNIWLGKNINSFDVLSFLIPLSLSALSISLLNSLKILFIGENKITYIKKPLVVMFFVFILLTALLYLQILNTIVYLYFWSISLFFLTIYLCFVFFKKIYIVK